VSFANLDGSGGGDLNTTGVIVAYPAVLTRLPLAELVC
jgi:hypothetical protein